MRQNDTQAAAAKCGRCHRTLTSPASIARGVGPRCAAIDAALDGLDDRQQDKAREAVEDGAVIVTGREGVAMVVSEDGESVHLVTADGHCSCMHGVRRVSATAKTCWHPGAVRLALTPRRTVRRSDLAKAA